MEFQRGQNCQRHSKQLSNRLQLLKCVPNNCQNFVDKTVVKLVRNHCQTRPKNCQTQEFITLSACKFIMVKHPQLKMLCAVTSVIINFCLLHYVWNDSMVNLFDHGEFAHIEHCKTCYNVIVLWEWKVWQLPWTDLITVLFMKFLAIYCTAGNFCGVLIFGILVVDMRVTKISTHEN